MNSSLRVKAARYLSALILSAASLCASAGNDDHANVVAEGARLPGDSIYQLPATFVDQDGKTFKLADLRGRPVIVSMFYNSCQFVCPMLIDTLRATQEGLSAEERAQLSLLLVTFDPARDDVGVLKSVATRRKLDREHWTLARTDPATVRKLAAVLHIQYKLLPNGDYNHSTALILLDADGRVIGSTPKIGQVDAEFLKLVQHAVHGK
ncbi:MAG: SCO family protein [Burkholderiaceae bacterium]|nr:SCO family protein [Burkholderiaceae bacterium]